MLIKRTDMPSRLWELWFMVTLIVAPLLFISVGAFFLAVFILDPNSTLFVVFAAIAAVGLLVVSLQQFFDFYYARYYLLAASGEHGEDNQN